MCLFHSGVFADSDEKQQMRKKAIKFIETNGAFAFLKSSIPNLFTKNYLAAHYNVVEDLINQSKNFSKEALVQYYTAMCNRPDNKEVIEKFNGPVLFIIGEQDTAIPLKISLQQAPLPNISFVSILSLSAHMGLWEETEKSNSILFNFLNRI